RGSFHLGAIARLRRRTITAADELDRILEVFVQVIEVLDDTIFGRSAYRKVIEHRKMLDELAQANSSCMWAYRNPKLRGQQQDRDVLVDPRNAGGVDLQNVDCLRLQKLLEHDSVVHDLSGCDLYWCDGLPDGSVPEDVVGAGRLFYPVGIVFGEFRHPVDRLFHAPLLVRIGSDADIGANRIASEAQTPLVLFQRSTNLQFDLVKPLFDGLLSQTNHLFVRIAQPTWAGCVRRISGGHELSLPIRLSSLGALEQVKSLSFAQGICQILEVHEFDELFGAHVAEILPERFPRDLCCQVPDRIDDGRRRHLEHALLRSKPAKLGVLDQSSGKCTGFAEDLAEGYVLDQR